MKDVSEYREELLKIARENSDVELALVATGYRSASRYLETITSTKRTDVGWANVSGVAKYRLGTIIKANVRRRDQLESWIKREQKELDEGEGGNEFYLELYKRELELLDIYALAALTDIITNGEALTEQAYEDEAERLARKEKAAAKKAANRAALKAIEDAQAQLESE